MRKLGPPPPPPLLLVLVLLLQPAAALLISMATSARSSADIPANQEEMRDTVPEWLMPLKLVVIILVPGKTLGSLPLVALEVLGVMMGVSLLLLLLLDEQQAGTGVEGRQTIVVANSQRRWCIV